MIVEAVLAASRDAGVRRIGRTPVVSVQRGPGANCSASGRAPVPTTSPGFARCARANRRRRRCGRRPAARRCAVAGLRRRGPRRPLGDDRVVAVDRRRDRRAGRRRRVGRPAAVAGRRQLHRVGRVVRRCAAGVCRTGLVEWTNTDDWGPDAAEWGADSDSWAHVARCYLQTGVSRSDYPIVVSGPQHRWVGSLSTAGLNQSVFDVPIVRRAAGGVFDETGVDLDSFVGATMVAALQAYPLAELFATSTDEDSRRLHRIARRVGGHRSRCFRPGQPVDGDGRGAGLPAARPVHHDDPPAAAGVAGPGAGRDRCRVHRARRRWPARAIAGAHARRRRRRPPVVRHRRSRAAGAAGQTSHG